MGEWLVGGGHNSTHVKIPHDGITIIELIAAFWKHAEVYYANPGGDSTSELTCYKYAFKPLRALYAETPAQVFGPIALKAVRQRMVDSGWSRPYTNAQVFRVKRLFKWAAGEELLSASVFQRLEAVESLRYGRTDAPEPDRVLPVEYEVVDATVKHLTPMVRAMVSVQRWTGMRPGELCRMQLADLDMSGETWTYIPKHHKTKYRGRTRKIYLGPLAQEALRPYLRSGLKGYLFTPEQSEAERREIMHANRKTPLSCGNVPGSHSGCRNTS